MRRLAVAACVAALCVVVVATAQESARRAPYWPQTSGHAEVSEWYSDIPWHQKLGTFAGNEIDEALVLPYEALGEKERAACTSRKLTPSACMIEYGINNILGTLRTDTLYSPHDARIRAARECRDPSLPCIEVMLELSSFWTRSTGSGAALQPRPFGREPDVDGFYDGYTITDGSTYAPQMPWYMTHYCDSFFAPSAADVQDPVCYGDYFSPMNNGFNPTNGPVDAWPNSSPWSVFPASAAPTNHCAAGETRCTLVMAGFDLSIVPPKIEDLQYRKYNEHLLAWFNAALRSFPANGGRLEFERHFPWTGASIDWETFLYPRLSLNPFVGQFTDTHVADANPLGCDVTLDGPTRVPCFNTEIRRAGHNIYPRRCTLDDVAGASTGSVAHVERLRQCGLNYELHHNGYLEQWPEEFWPAVREAGMVANQYGRTSFLFAGVPGMQLPVSFYKAPDVDGGLTIYERVYNSSIFSLYLPITNVDDVTRAFHGRNYTDKEFYHTLLMSNHMESDPWHFADGVRGKVLWHNEYRTQKMYERRSPTFNPDRTFAAAFDAATATSPFHNNTCDGCHVRNGSGIPINTSGKLDASLQEFMTGAEYNPSPAEDYTFSGQIRPMKLVFFDLRRNTSGLDASRYSEPLSFAPNLVAHPPRTVDAADFYYNNRIMNFHGDSFHVTTPGYTYAWSYEPANPNRIVATAARFNAELGTTYAPRQVKVGGFETRSPCQLVLPPPTSKPWPRDCNDVDGTAIGAAIDSNEIGFMLLNGKRLGNLSAMEAIPNQAILGFREAQRATLGERSAGEVIWNAGSRDGSGGNVHKVCATRSLVDCYIGRFGWIGDRASLEDQVANAAFVEMNMTTSEGYKKLYASDKVMFPIRYAYPNCGPANKTCVESRGNADLSERDIQRMADYARWLGSPTRSEFEVSLPDVIAGEKVFRRLQCDTCHVIDKVDIAPDDTMLSRDFRGRLQTRIAGSARPFLSYIGTDLLMHDMGYLSQVANATQAIRDSDGVVLPAFANYMQKIRTPALKGLRFNRLVTDAHRNTKRAGDPACDFLLHDGRACDAIEASFLHDGPAIRKLRTIEGLSGLTPAETRELRAFLYSL